MNGMKFYCLNCEAPLSELKNEFPDIPDLLQRISPGELVPAGECPHCGALVHLLDALDQDELPPSIRLPKAGKFFLGKNRQPNSLIYKDIKGRPIDHLQHESGF